MNYPNVKILLVLFLLLFSSLSSAETIRLKSGVTFEGKIIELTDDHVVIDKGNKSIFRFNFAQIDDESLTLLKFLPKKARNPSPLNIPLSKTEQDSTHSEPEPVIDPSITEANVKIKEAIAKVHEQGDAESFYFLKKVAEEVDCSKVDCSILVSEVLRHAAFFMGLNIEADRASCLKVAQDQVNFIEKMGGLDQVIVVLKRFFQEKDFQQVIDNTYIVGYTYLSSSSAEDGQFEKAREYLAMVKKYASLNKFKTEEDTIDRYEKFFKYENELIPLYRTLVMDGHHPESSVNIARLLFPIYKELDFYENTSGSQLIEKLEKYKYVFNQFIDKQLSMADRFIMYADLVSLYALDDLRKARDVGAIDIKRNPEMFACNYHSYLTYILLKAKGIRNDYIYTNEVDVSKNLNIWKDWKNIFLITLGFKNKKMKGAHACNIVWIDGDHFVVVDWLNQYIGSHYSWSNDIVRADNQYAFRNTDSYVKNFQIGTVNIIHEQFLVQFSRIFLNDVKYKYISQAVKLQPEESESLVTLGDYLIEDGKLEDAEEVVKKLKVLNFRSTEIELKLLLQRGNFQEALGVAQKLVSNNPDEGRFYQYLSVIYSRLGDLPKAKECLKNAINTYESNHEIYQADSLKSIQL